MAQSPLPPMASDRLARRREHLMAEIALQAEQRPPTRVRLIAAAAAVVVLAVGISVVTSVTGGPSGHGPAAFAIEPLPEGGVSIRVVDSKVSAEEMTAQLQEAGLNITIETMPASRQVIGRWMTVGATEDVPERLYDSLVEQALGNIATLTIDRRFPGELTLGVGRAPEPGEALQVGGSPNALAPGGLLHCLRISGQDPAVAAEAVTAAGYSVVWGGQVGRHVIDAPPAGSKVVLGYVYESPAMAPKGFVGDANTVQLIVWDPADPAYDKVLWMGYPLAEKASGQRDYSSCPAT